VNASQIGSRKAIVYLGPSMPAVDAEAILHAEYRSPIRRGDLESIESGSVVAIIDGVFEQNLAVSVQELDEAIRRGVIIFGGASMGALRAAEVPGIIGVGRVFDWYRLGIIDRDDEVALLFADESGVALTVPCVNVRFAVERLCRAGTLDRSTGEAIVASTLSIPYKERTYSAIVDAAGLSRRIDKDDLIAMLRVHDIKRSDAQAVLEAVDRYQQAHGRTYPGPVKTTVTATACIESALIRQGCNQTSVPQSEVLIWESGDRVSHEDLIEFFAYTGQLEHRAAKLASSPLLPQTGDRHDDKCAADVQCLFSSAARRWGWMSAEETSVTLTDLGLNVEAVGAGCKAYFDCVSKAALYFRKASAECRRAFVAELFLDGLSLKRVAMRLGGLRWIAARADSEPEQEEWLAAEKVLMKVSGELSSYAMRQRWVDWGFSDPVRQDAFIRLLARARQVAQRLVGGIQCGGMASTVALKPSAFGYGPCPKAPGDSRFSLPLAEAEEHARRIGKVIGVTRVGMIGELAGLSGIQIAQAARPGNAWSSSYGSGKSLSASGAVIGSIMEETEKWAQEQFRPGGNILTGSYLELRGRSDIVDPATLDLPYDTIYSPDMRLEWYACRDLIGDRWMYLPVDVLDMRHRKHDICFTARGGRKHLATNGLASGFRREEAIVHGLCEYVERHAQRMAEILLSNPGDVGPHFYSFIDLATGSPQVRDIAQRLTSRNTTVRVLDITSEIQIPSFFATAIRDMKRADGFATHPNPNVAIEMALLEAAQTIAGSTAGGREDLSIHARSLGRHERPRPVDVSDAWFWMDPDCIEKPISEVAGFYSDDIYSELAWCLARLQAANVSHALVVELTPPGIAPVSVVRVILPGLETNNPFYTGLRARLLLLKDLLPRWR
jgi:ribosomal protein S12 methylthiotransferase accessory factor